jgi:hypothetical protein
LEVVVQAIVAVSKLWEFVLDQWRSRLESMRSQSTPGPFLRPVRVTITIPYNAYQALIERSNDQGRSLSNLAAYLIETSLQALPSNEHHQSRGDGLDFFQRHG